MKKLEQQSVEESPPNHAEQTPVSEEQLHSALEKRAQRKTHRLAHLALMAFLGAGLESGTGHVLQERQREAMEAQADPHAAERQGREEIRLAVGNDALRVLDGYRTKGAPETQVSQEGSEQRERERVHVEGFEALGFSSEVLRQELERILPAEWMNTRNIRTIRFSDESPPEVGASYGIHAHRAADCSRSTTPGEPSVVTVYRNALEMNHNGPQYGGFLQILIHEISHANDSRNSSTLPPEPRQEQYRWLSQRALAMEHGDISRGHRRYAYGIAHLRNAIDSWTGDRYAFPEPGEGYLPLSYPRGINNPNREVRNELVVGETFAETVSLIVTLPTLPHFSPIAPEGDWRTRSAMQLSAEYGYRMSMTWRTDSDAYQDALAHIDFVEGIMPNLEARQQAAQEAVKRLEGNYRVRRAGEEMRSTVLGEQVSNLLQQEGSPNGPSYNWLVEEAPRIRERLARVSPQTLTEFDEVVARYQQSQERFRSQGEASLTSPEARQWYREQWVPFLNGVMHAKREIATHPTQAEAILHRLTQDHRRVQTAHDTLLTHLPADQQRALEEAVRLETWLHTFDQSPQDSWSATEQQKLNRVYDVIYAHLGELGADSLIRSRTDLPPERLEQLIATGQ